MKINPFAQSSFAVLSLLFAPSTASPQRQRRPTASRRAAASAMVARPLSRNFTMPDASKCTPWAGYTKTSATVIFTTSGTACVSSDSTALTVSVSSADPDYLGVGTLAVDYIRMTRANTTDPFAGEDQGYLMGGADQVNCTSDLLTLPATHD